MEDNEGGTAKAAKVDGENKDKKVSYEELVVKYCEQVDRNHDLQKQKDDMQERLIEEKNNLQREKDEMQKQLQKEINDLQREKQNMEKDLIERLHNTENRLSSLKLMLKDEKTITRKIRMSGSAVTASTTEDGCPVPLVGVTGTEVHRSRLSQLPPDAGEAALQTAVAKCFELEALRTRRTLQEGTQEAPEVMVQNASEGRKMSAVRVQSGPQTTTEGAETTVLVDTHKVGVMSNKYSPDLCVYHPKEQIVLAVIELKAPREDVKKTTVLTQVYKYLSHMLEDVPSRNHASCLATNGRQVVQYWLTRDMANENLYQLLFVEHDTDKTGSLSRCMELIAQFASAPLVQHLGCTLDALRFAGSKMSVTEHGKVSYETGLVLHMVEYLGSGGSAKVYKCTVDGLASGTEYAVKVPPDLTQNEEGNERRCFGDEAAVYRRLAMHKYGNDHGLLECKGVVGGEGEDTIKGLILHPCVEGVSHWRIPRPSEESTCAVAFKALLGLRCAHEAGVICNDIRPSNILAVDKVTPSWVPDADSVTLYLSDFGHAYLYNTGVPYDMRTLDKSGPEPQMIENTAAVSEHDPGTDFLADVGNDVYCLLACVLRVSSYIVLQRNSKALAVLGMRTSDPTPTAQVWAKELGRAWMTCKECSIHELRSSLENTDLTVDLLESAVIAPLHKELMRRLKVARNFRRGEGFRGGCTM